MWICFDILAGVASIFNLTAVSIDRYIHVARPLTHSKLITKTRVIGVIFLIWVFASGMALIKGVISWKRPNYEMLVFFIGFMIPLLGIIFCYIRIYSVVKIQLKKFQATTSTIRRNTHLMKDIKAIKTIAIIVIAFFICWCPFFILTVIDAWCGCTLNHTLITFSKVLHYSNSALNPIIYACFNKEYRKGFVGAMNKYTNKYENGPLVRFIRLTSSREPCANDSITKSSYAGNDTNNNCRREMGRASWNSQAPLLIPRRDSLEIVCIHN